MSKIIDLTNCGVATIKNIYTPDFVEDKDEALGLLDPIPADQVFNTGASSVGDPHIDAKYVAGNIGKALIKDNDPFDYDHVASLRLWGGSGNSFVYLNPGDTITLAVTADQALFYLNQKGGYLDVEIAQTGEGGASVITEVEDAEAPAEFDEPYLDRTTGVGDDGGPINFDSAKVTEEMNGETAGADEPDPAAPEVTE